MELLFDTSSLEDYRRFLAVRECPIYQFRGCRAIVPDEYASNLGLTTKPKRSRKYEPIEGLFDYQRDIAALATRKHKYAIFAECGLGKTLMQLEFARHAAMVNRGGRILIVSPLMVVEQTIEEALRWYGERFDIGQVRAVDLQYWLESNDHTQQIGITNYEAIREGLRPGKLSGLILDECFPPGTFVDCVESDTVTQKRIETIVSGDRILNAAGVDSVVQVKRKKVKYAVIVKAGTEVTCSPNHPWFTQRGWVCAQDLEPGDSVLSSIAAMRIVRDRVYAEGHAGAFEVLREVLLSEMENVTAGTSGQGSHERDAHEDWEIESSMVRQWERLCKTRDRENPTSQSDGESGHQSEVVCNIEEHEPSTFRAWGQWSRDDLIAIADAGCTGRRMDSGISIVAGKTESWVSDALQTRLSQYRSESEYRSGWSLSQIEEGSRREAGCDDLFTRVEGLEVLELGHPRLDRFRDASGELYFYDIEANRHPSFSVSGMLVHNSSMLKSHYGEYGTRLIELGRGLDWKLCSTGTPAPNDRIEFANHAVFLDRAKTVNEFLATYFINRGETQNRWELKPHALKPFYRSLADWSIFLTNPATYGWKDNVGTMPPMHVHIDHIELTPEQRKAAQTLTGSLITNNIGGIGERGKLSQIAKGKGGIPTNKPAFIRGMVDSWPDESTIIWCRYNDEQEQMERTFPEAVSISGDTPIDKRREMIRQFKSGEKRVMITKAKILGFGLNLQVCTRQIFSGLNDSFEEFHQAVKRSNRIGSTKDLHVHIPVTELEVPFVDNVLRKAHRVESDTLAQEALFKEIGHECIR